MSGQLCKHCSDALHEIMRAKQDSGWRDDNIPLAPSVCCICANLAKTTEIDLQDIESMTPSRVCFEFRVDPSDRDLVELRVYAYWRPNVFRIVFTAFTVMPSDDRQLCWIQDISADTLSQDAVSFLRSKLANCLETHTDCRKYAPASNARYPTRLLSVKARDSKVILMDTQRETYGHYFTLSHCWGGSQPLKLTCESEQLLRDGIDIDVLPKTFQHAIQICRQMDVSYIWIDSMCIFQDDLTDWHVQANTMRQVYSLALCNIAASSAPDSSYGLRFHRNLNTLQPFTVVAPRQSWHLVDEEPLIRYIFHPNRYHSNYIQSGPLNKRSWVLQESLLSSRIMHFTGVGVYWECLHDLSSDLYPGSLPRNQFGTEKDVQISELKRLLLRELRLDSDEIVVAWTAGIYDGWNRLCERYSLCHLTVASDKLVALNGIAQEVGLKTGDSLICGLWRRHLLPQLLWVQFPAQGHNWAINEWRAPSWSWAQHDIAFAQYPHMPCEASRDRATVELLDVSTAPSGQLQHASLTLRGRIVHATLTTEPSALQLPSRSAKFTFKNTGISSQVMEDLHLDYPYKEQGYHAQVACIAVYEDTCTLGVSGSVHWEAPLGILVLRECCSEPIKYERIGVLLLRKEYCDLYTSFESSEEHSVTIV